MTAVSITPNMRPREGSLRILVSDDQPDILEALRLLLKGAGYLAETVDSPQALLRALDARSFDLILMDLNYARDTTSGQEGLDLLDKLRVRTDCAPVVVMTAWGNVELAVDAMHRGATDFVQKPWDNLRLLGTIEKQAREAAARRSAERQARSEIEIARHVQEKLFPQPVKQLRSIEYAARCVPARDVSGDYYDFLDLGPDALGFVLADVSGKGMAAALLMASLQAAFRSQTEVLRGCELLRSINRQFHSSTPPEQYATLFYADYDDRSRMVRYINCGHPAPLLVRADGAVERLPSTAPVVGLLEVWDCEEAAMHIGPGDTLVAFSDGVTEAGIEDEAEFGEERLIAAVTSARGASPDEIIDDVMARICAHAGAAADDCTMLVIRGVGSCQSGRT
ncbi:MAG: SpoIIE family protein phosphatase [Bryobacteraceae bacterium]|jgi:sigma-B regulation protein RsbU (phosphoserine phosphatase)